MKNTIIIILMLILLSDAKSDELIWDYDHGWTKGYILKLNDKTKTISIYDRNTQKKEIKPLTNASNIIKYFKTLLALIPLSNDDTFAIDGVVNKITLTTDKKVIKRTFGGIDLPGILPYNENTSPEMDLNIGKNLKKNLNAFLVEHMLHQLYDFYFKKRKTIKENNSNDVTPLDQNSAPRKSGK
jgi:hypothetical protein